MDTLRPQDLTPYVFNSAYDDAKLRTHYLQAQTIIKDWLYASHTSSPETLRTLLENVPSRPLARRSSQDKAETDTELKDVLGLFSKYQFQYRRPCRLNTEATLDQWWTRGPLATQDLPENLIDKSLCVLAGDFGDAKALVPGDLFWPTSTTSAIGDMVYSLLSKSESQLYARTVVGVSFPLYL